MEKDCGLVFSAGTIREKGGLTVKKSLEPEIFAAALESPAGVKKASMELVFSVGSGSILLEGVVNAEMDLPCARCGALFTARFSENFDEVYEDAVESIDVRGPLVESVALMTPLKPLCSASCKGLCQVCGGNRNLKICGCRAEQKPDAGADGKENPFSALKKLRGKKDPG